MNEYTAGDLVEAVKGKSVKSQTVIRGQLTRLGDYLWVGDSGRTPENLESYGFTLSIVEKAAAVVVLPTEPGFYITAHIDPQVFELLNEGSWFCGEEEIPEARVSHDGGNRLTRLEPVSETAKKVLDRVNGWWARDERRGLPIFLSALREEFGVTK